MDYERLLTLIDEQVRQHAHTRFCLISRHQEEAHSGMGGDSRASPVCVPTCVPAPSDGPPVCCDAVMV
jgi:hypothetical protein